MQRERVRHGSQPHHVVVETVSELLAVTRVVHLDRGGQQTAAANGDLLLASVNDHGVVPLLVALPVHLYTVILGKRVDWLELRRVSRCETLWRCVHRRLSLRDRRVVYPPCRRYDGSMHRASEKLTEPRPIRL